MKKKLLSLLLALAMLTPALAACGNGTPDEMESDTGVQEDIGGAEQLSDTVYLVADGVSEYVIVRGENAGEQEIFASTELQSYLKQITGAELPIVTDATPAVAKEIVVGQTNRETEGQFDRTELVNDGFILKTEAGKLWLIGGDARGTLYAVYELLEAYLGCRFYTATFEKVPETKTVTLSIAEDKQIPVFETRTTGGSAIAGIEDKLRLGYGGTWAGSSNHTLPGLAERGNGTSRDPCLLKEETYETVLKNLRALLAENPDARYVSISQGDLIHCYCADCASSAEEIGWTAHYLLFYNRLAAAIAEEFPDVLIHIFAYDYTKEPPKIDIVPADNIMVQFCTIEACFSHPLTEKCYCETPDGRDEDYEPLDWVAMLDGWAKISDNIAIWDYTSNYSGHGYGILIPNFHVLRENMRFFADHNAMYIYEQGPTHADTGEFDELRSYLLAKLMWNPYMSEEEYNGYMNEFLEDYYGPGWEYIRAYIDAGIEAIQNTNLIIWSTIDWLYPAEELATAKKSDDIPTFTKEQLENCSIEDLVPYFPWLETQTVTNHPVVVLGFENFARAMEMAETDEQRAHLDESLLHLEYINLYNHETLLNKAKAALANIFIAAVNAANEAGEISDEDMNPMKIAFNKNLDGALKADYYILYRQFVEKCINYGVYKIGYYSDDMRNIDLDALGK